MNDHVKELLYQMLETELGGVQVYTTALECVVNDDLEEEWTEYLEQTERHVEVMRELFSNIRPRSRGANPGASGCTPYWRVACAGNANGTGERW